jgi:hypothetical protein
MFISDLPTRHPCNARAIHEIEKRSGGANRQHEGGEILTDFQAAPRVPPATRKNKLMCANYFEIAFLT